MISTLSTMVQELAFELSKRNKNVTICSVIAKNRLDLNENIENISLSNLDNDVKIIRVKSSFLNNSNFIIRGFYQLFFHHIFWYQIKQELNEKIDVVISYSPPLPLALLGAKIKKHFGSYYILNIQDIFPQNAIDLGILKNRLLIKYFENKEKFSYQSADKLTSHTKMSRQFLITKKNILPEKIELITNWIDIKKFSNSKHSSYFRDFYELKNKFIFLFAGIIGPSQGLDFIIDMALRVKNTYPKICFLIVGEGLDKKRLMGISDKYKLDNVLFKPFVSIDEYPKLVNCADIGIISLNNLNKTGVYPAKILGYMAASLPILAFLHKNSDGHELVNNAKCGISINSDEKNIEKISELIIKMYLDKGKLKKYGENGFKYVQDHFSKTRLVKKIDSLINDSKKV